MATDLGVAPEEMRVLVLAPRGRDAALTRELLDAERMRCHVCSSIEELCSNLRNGAGTAIVAHEALDDRARLALRSVLAAQPAWSDLQVIVFTDERRRGEALPGLELIGNVMPIDRPVPVRAMISSVRSALRARLRQYEVRRALRARDQFLAMLGHELRNPLGAIRLAAEVLDGSGVCGQNNRQLAVIERQSMHLTRLVDDLLDVSRVTSGKVSLKKVRVDLNELLRNCLQTAEPQLKSHQLTLRTELETRPLPVFGDRVRLEQVFGNLISNAIK
ncbi:MAG TPA: HAMP domain-containing sensor histidine kinase, partial [Polyangiales bacterium]|nr:HAMP domain-containing sensor histidine kinase [Polyangiales bacterium]